MNFLKDRYQKVLQRIQSIPGPSPTLIAVSKFQPLSAVRELYQLGHRDFGENYVQELQEKARTLQQECPDIRWHFIGHLQTNKVKALLPWVTAIHSVDSFKLAGELSKRWERDSLLQIFLQVNVDHQESKGGLDHQDVPVLAQRVAALPGLQLKGLMCIPDPTRDPREAFAQLKALEQRCRPHTQGGLSMGMSADFEMALKEGATHIRIGSDIFGPRPSQSTNG